MSVILIQYIYSITIVVIRRST